MPTYSLLTSHGRPSPSPSAPRGCGGQRTCLSIRRCSYVEGAISKATHRSKQCGKLTNARRAPRGVQRPSPSTRPLTLRHSLRLFRICVCFVGVFLEARSSLFLRSRRKLSYDLQPDFPARRGMAARGRAQGRGLPTGPLRQSRAAVCFPSLPGGITSCAGWDMKKYNFCPCPRQNIAEMLALSGKKVAI